MAPVTDRRRDWLGSWHSSALAWWIPQAALIVGLFAPDPIKVVMWAVSLFWMGLACILNSRRCGRTHCQYTGPYYLAMIMPVLVFGLGLPSFGLFPWIVLGAVIVGGSRIIWWATERAWGTFS